MNEKFKKLFEESGLSQKVFSSNLGISQPQLNKYLNCGVDLSDKTFKKYAKIINLNFYKNLVLHQAFCKLESMDLDNPESFGFEFTVNDLILECRIESVSLAYRNRYRFDGVTIGKYKPEPSHTYELGSIYIDKVFSKEKESHIQWSEKDSINNTLFLINKI